MAEQVPSVGRIVHYILPEGPHTGEHRPAIIVKIWDPARAIESRLQLQVFTDSSNDGLPPVHWATSVQFAEPQLHEFGTWHWPEYVPAV